VRVAVQYEFTTNAWVGVLVALALSLLIGFINGWIVVKTGIPSFLVTLGTFFMLQGLNIALTQTITNQVSSPDISTLQGFNSARPGVLGQLDHRRGEHQDQRDLLDRLRHHRDLDLAAAPASATGSSPSAATRRRPGRSACRSAG
jgi:hypothetical protein